MLPALPSNRSISPPSCLVFQHSTPAPSSSSSSLSESIPTIYIAGGLASTGISSVCEEMYSLTLRTQACSSPPNPDNDNDNKTQWTVIDTWEPSIATGSIPLTLHVVLQQLEPPSHGVIGNEWYINHCEFGTFRYNLCTKQFDSIASLSEYYSICSIVRTNRWYAIGRQRGGDINEVHMYDPSWDNNWITLPNYPMHLREGAAGVNIKAGILVMGGLRQNDVASSQCFLLQLDHKQVTAENLKWIPFGPSLPMPLFGHSAICITSSTYFSRSYYKDDIDPFRLTNWPQLFDDSTADFLFTMFDGSYIIEHTHSTNAVKSISDAKAMDNHDDSKCENNTKNENDVNDDEIVIVIGGMTNLDKYTPPQCQPCTHDFAWNRAGWWMNVTLPEHQRKWNPLPHSLPFNSYGATILPLFH